MRVRLLLVSIFLVAFFAALLALPAAAQAKHPFTFEDMMKLKRVGEPVPSPDGKWVLFSVMDVDLAANKKTPHIWIVPLAGGAGAMSLSPIRMGIVRGGRRMGSGLRFSRIRRVGRRFGLPSLMACAGAVTAVAQVDFDCY